MIWELLPKSQWLNTQKSLFICHTKSAMDWGNSPGQLSSYIGSLLPASSISWNFHFNTCCESHHARRGQSCTAEHRQLSACIWRWKCASQVSTHWSKQVTWPPPTSRGQGRAILSHPENRFCWTVVTDSSENIWSKIENLALNKISFYFYTSSPSLVAGTEGGGVNIIWI